jgi:hypothetical protein
MLFEDLAGEQLSHFTNLNGLLVAFTPRLVVLGPSLSKLVDVTLPLLVVEAGDELGERLKHAFLDFLDVLKEVEKDRNEFSLS